MKCFPSKKHTQWCLIWHKSKQDKIRSLPWMPWSHGSNNSKDLYSNDMTKDRYDMKWVSSTEMLSNMFLKRNNSQLKKNLIFLSISSKGSLNLIEINGELYMESMKLPLADSISIKSKHSTSLILWYQIIKKKILNRLLKYSIQCHPNMKNLKMKTLK